MSTILVVDDELSIRKTLGLLLKSKGYIVLDVATIDQARQMLAENSVDLVITDMRLEDEDGMDLLIHLRDSGSQAESIVMTAYASVETAVEAMRLGAYDYLTKPINVEELLIRVAKVLERKSLHEEVTRLRDTLSGRDHLKNIVAESASMRQILDVIERIRSRDISVLITGETGTGKEVIARAIHETSDRAEGPCVAINCCTLPEELLDSELFGHVKGAFTGATKDRKGLFQQADGGTLFLDEIGDITPRLQAKLLRVLQESEIRPVGGTHNMSVDVRVIAATNRDLDKAVADGEFRSDLLFRLNVLPIAIPPLRVRHEDIIPLVRRFLSRLCERLGRDDLSLTVGAQEKLIHYDWPGNVRQLENVIERSFALSPGSVLDADEIIIITGSATTTPVPEEDAKLSLETIEIRHIRKILAAHDGNQVAAARVLGISRSTLRRKLSDLD